MQACVCVDGETFLSTIEKLNVSFNDREGNLLPGGAKRLNETTDWSLTVDYETFADYMNLTT